MKTVLNCGYTSAELLELVVADYRSIVETMRRNMASDAACGYSAAALKKQQEEIDAYKARKGAEIENWNDKTARHYARLILCDEF